MGILLLVARFALAAVFAVAGLAKLRDAGGARKSLGEFGVPAAFTPALAALLPLAELTCAIALVWDRWAVPGAIGVMALLGVFIVGITVNLARGRTVNCHCFGQLSSSPVSLIDGCGAPTFRSPTKCDPVRQSCRRSKHGQRATG